jgi:hypothetical protein
VKAKTPGRLDQPPTLLGFERQVRELERFLQLQQFVGDDDAAALLALVDEEPRLNGPGIDHVKCVDDVLEA